MVLLAGTGASATVALAGAYVRVRVEAAHLREGPGTGFAPVAWAVENEPLRVLERRGAWLRTRTFRGREGWIARRLTDEGAAVVVTARVNVRTGPGTHYPVVFTAEQGVAFRVLRVEGDWVKVEHADGDRGWLHRSLVWGRW